MSDSDEKLISLGDTTLRRGLMGNTVLLVVAVAGLVGGVLLYGSYQAIGEISETSVEQAVERTQADLEGFFGPVETKAEMFQDWGEAGELSYRREDIERLNAGIRPILKRNSQLTAVALGDTTGRQYVFWRDDSSWIGRFLADDGVEEADFIRWSDEGERLESWSEPVGESDWQRPWFSGAMAGEKGSTHWTEPFVFFTDDQPGMTASRRFQQPGTDEYNVVAVGVSLDEISQFTMAMQPSERGYNTVLTPTGDIVGLPSQPRYTDEDVVRDEVLNSWEELGLDGLGRAYEIWREEGSDDATIKAEDDDIGEFWAGFRHFELGDQALVASTVIPRQDLTGAVDRQRNVAVVIGLVGIGLTVLLSMWISARYRKRMEKVYDDAQHLGQYRLIEKLGVGGMGKVYRAEHAMMERPTAVKLLKPDMYDETSIKRFEREVQMTCRLTHPNTVTIFDYGETKEGLFYYAMELLEGVTLDQLLGYTGPLDDSRVVYLMRQVCGALVEAHDIGLIHRDIKPSNIMVACAGGLGDRVTVLDFGLVKDIESTEDTQLTNQDYMQGSPGFMAPEVIQGGASDNPTVDIFAVGAVMYTLLCNRSPFEGNSPVEIIMAQVQKTPKKPSEILGREVDPELESLIMACLQKTAEQRPSSIHEVRQRLVDLDVHSDWTMQDALSWWEEHGHKVVPEKQSQETFSGPKAFEMTMTMADDEIDTTLDEDPEELVDDEVDTSIWDSGGESTQSEDVVQSDRSLELEVKGEEK